MVSFSLLRMRMSRHSWTQSMITQLLAMKNISKISFQNQKFSKKVVSKGATQCLLSQKAAFLTITEVRDQMILKLLYNSQSFSNFFSSKQAYSSYYKNQQLVISWFLLNNSLLIHLLTKIKIQSQSNHRLEDHWRISKITWSKETSGGAFFATLNSQFLMLTVVLQVTCLAYSSVEIVYVSIA